MKIEIKRKIASDALKQGVINEVECDLLQMHCDNIERLERISDKMADDYYGRMVNNQATIKLKEDEND